MCRQLVCKISLQFLQETCITDNEWMRWTKTCIHDAVLRKFCSLPSWEIIIQLSLLNVREVKKESANVIVRQRSWNVCYMRFMEGWIITKANSFEMLFVLSLMVSFCVKFMFCAKFMLHPLSDSKCLLRFLSIIKTFIYLAFYIRYKI